MTPAQSRARPRSAGIFTAAKPVVNARQVSSPQILAQASPAALSASRRSFDALAGQQRVTAATPHAGAACARPTRECQS